MKRLFSNKSGFSLAEIIVAIAIFSIMLAMIMQMLQVSIAQRNENTTFAKNLAQQQDDLAAKGKDTTIPTDGLGNPMIDGTIRLNFVNPNASDPTKPLFKDSTGDGIPIDYTIKATDPGATDIANGLNYFIGDFDYNADGTGVIGGEDGTNGAGQSAQYDTRITGTKGLKNITIVECSKTTSVPGVSLNGKIAYKMTVTANSGSMQTDDKKYSQMKFYFYSSDEYTIQKVSKTRIGADGKPVMKADGKTPETDDYYKKVYKAASLVQVVPDSGNTYLVQKSSNNSIRIGMPLDGSCADGFSPSKDTTFYLIFSGDPKISSTSFGEGGGNVYNCASIYDEKTGTDTGKYHVNIYGAKKVEVHAKKEDFK